MKKIQELCRNYQEMIFRALGEGNAFEDLISCYFEGVGRLCTSTKELMTILENNETTIVRVLCKYEEDGSHDFMFILYPEGATKANNGVSNVCKMRIWDDLSEQNNDVISSLLLMLDDDWWFSDQAKELVKKHCDIEFKSDKELDDYIRNAPTIEFEVMDDGSLIKRIIP